MINNIYRIHVAKRQVSLLSSLRLLSIIQISSLIGFASTAESIKTVSGENKGAIRALANDHIVFDESDSTEGRAPLNTPTIISLGGGRLVAASELGVKKWRDAGNPWARISTSDDGGLTWTPRTTANLNQARLFRSGKSIYYLGYSGDLKIMRSDDRGETWSAPANLETKKAARWYAAACNVLKAKGNIYLVMERKVYTENKSGWTIGDLAPVLMRAREGDDLTLPSSWTYASELAFVDIIPGYRENNLAIDFFGLPFFSQNYPLAQQVSKGRSMYPMGWLETNVVQFTDPEHLWFDPQQRTLHLFMRVHSGNTGYAAIAQVVENEDGTMTTGLVKAPSGKTMLFLPFPGGHMKFHVEYDAKTKLYWMVGTQATDSMIRPEMMDKDRYQLGYNQRDRLVLHYSKNMVDWSFAGLVASVSGNVASRNYASMDIDGEDLVILSRSGDDRAHSAHNGNLITFHRIKNFRSLVW